MVGAADTDALGLGTSLIGATIGVGGGVERNVLIAFNRALRNT